MGAVFDAQFRILQAAALRADRQIDIAFTPAGKVDYLYERGRILTLARATDASLPSIEELLPGISPVERQDAESGEFTVWSLEGVADGNLTVPEALDVIDERLGDRNPGLDGGEPFASPNHVIHTCRLCSANEPELPTGNAPAPWPEARPRSETKRDVTIGISDTGLLDDIDLALVPWLDGVEGEQDRLDPPLQPGGLPRIPAYAGHGTFIAGVARCMAPSASVYVNNHFTLSGGELESVILAKLEELADPPANSGRTRPDIINLSAGTYCRRDWRCLGFEAFRRRHPDIVLVAAAGNESTNRKFYPAAYDWALSVGALASDQVHRAWFSNYGSWVDLYVVGEGHVNAYATGTFTYNEPPKQPAQQDFAGMARWDGTSYSAPMVAGMIAARMAREDESAADAKSAVIAAAQARVLPGVGPSLLMTDTP